MNACRDANTQCSDHSWKCVGMKGSGIASTMLMAWHSAGASAWAWTSEFRLT
jgi:hypothetical protein